jgi:spore coat-associated protein N
MTRAPRAPRAPRLSAQSRLAAAALNATVALLDNARRLAMTSATGVLALSSVALGTYAGFSAYTSGPGNTFSLGTVQMTTTLGAPSGAGAFSFGTFADMVPGESVTRFLDVANTGTLDFTYVMSSAATASSALNTDVTNGLQLEIKQCSLAWTGVDSCGAGGTVSTLYTGRLAPLAGQPVSLGTVSAGGGTAHLQLKVTLPGTATALSGLSSTLELTWTATNT